MKFKWREQARIQRLVDSHNPSDVADYLNKTGKMATALPPITIVAVEVIGMSGMADIMGAVGGKVGTTTERQVGRHWLDFIRNILLKIINIYFNVTIFYITIIWISILFLFTFFTYTYVGLFI